MKRVSTVFQNGVARFALVCAVVSTSSLLATAGWSQSLTWLGSLGGGFSTAWGVSSDGSVVVGVSVTSAYETRAFRWVNGVMENLGTLGGDSEARGVSADGNVVVGWYRTDFGDYPFRWTPSGNMQNIGALGRINYAWGVSGNGAVVVGQYFDFGLSSYIAFRWTEDEGMQSIPGLIEARAASFDGSVVVGTSGTRAYRWVNGQLFDLGVLTDYPNHFYAAYGVSSDGQAVVGTAYGQSGSRAFLWTEDSGMRDLGGAAPSDFIQPFGVSNNLVVVGAIFGANIAFRWTEQDGLEDLNVRYANLLGPGSRLSGATAISPDGRYIVGYGLNNGVGDSFLLDTGAPRRAGDVNGDGCVDDSDLLRVLFAFGNTGANLPEDLNGDNTVDDADLLEVLFNFGSGC